MRGGKMARARTKLCFLPRFSYSYDTVSCRAATPQTKLTTPYTTRLYFLTVRLVPHMSLLCHLATEGT